MSNSIIDLQKYIGEPIFCNEISSNIANDQKNNCIVKIKIDQSYGTGFLCKIPFGNNSKLMPVLITNNHIIDEDYIRNRKYIEIFKEKQETKYNLNFEIQRRFYNNKDMDFTIIEIKHEDNFGLKYFLEIDDNIEVPNFEYKKAYIIHFPKGNDAIFQQGIIEKIKDNTIYHKCNTEKGSSGCPILNYKTNKVFGVHKGANKNPNKHNNLGIFIKVPIKLFYEEMKKQGKDYYENYFDGINSIDIKYKVEKSKSKLKLFGDKFVNNNIHNCKIIIYGKEYGLCKDINISDFNYDNSGVISIKLEGIKYITNMSYMFHKCYNLLSVSNLSQINTSKVTNMSRMFEGCLLLETLEGISDWDISNVKDIRGMFYYCKSLKKISNISNWNTKNVIEMKQMFWSCLNLNPTDMPDIRKWNVLKAKDSKYIFEGYQPGKNKNIPISLPFF